MKVKNLVLIAAFAATAAWTACSKDDDVNPELSQQDRDFMMRATHGNLAEIELGEMAQQKATDDSVSMFGTMMISDHSGAHAELDSIARSVNYPLPTDLDAMHQAVRLRLDTLQGFAFDTAYINQQIMDHQRTITLFEAQANQGSYQPLRAYANKYLPAIRDHHEMAQNIANSLQ